MYCRQWSSLLFLSLLGLSHGQRRKGGGGWGGGDDDSHEGDNDDDFDYDDGDEDSGLPDNSAPCGWWPRQEAFGLPGLYYNGTLTVNHRITGNTAWDDERGGVLGGCDNDDKEPKSYQYPAMILIAPTGNDSDTNPMHWVLKAFQPAHEMSYNQADVDFRQRWVYIRSSDFVVSNQTTIWDSPFSPYRTDHLAETDATLMEETTRVYWETNVTSNNDNTFSAHAEYVKTPPLLDPDTYRNSASWRAGLYSSQYVTLNDVCSYDQEFLDERPDDEIEAIQREAAGMERRQDDDDDDDNDERSWEATNPTLWLPLGTTLEMDGIGADTMSWKMNTSFEKAIPWKGMREGGSCNAFNAEPFEMSDFIPWQSRNNEESYIVPWNVSITINLQFEGDLVSENSTSLEGQRDGKLVFGEGYARFIEQDEAEQEDSAAKSAIGLYSLVWALVAWIAFTI